MAALLLDSLQIKGFRAFRDLRLEKLGRVNLIVGKNNIGKSCLLEALQLYAHRAQPRFLWQTLRAHNEITNSLPVKDEKVNRTLSIVKNLFHDWPDPTKPVPPIEIGPINAPNATLRLSLETSADTANGTGLVTSEVPLSEEPSNAEPALPHFAVQLGKSHPIVYPLETPSDAEQPKPEIPPINCLLTEGYGFEQKMVNILWDRIASSDLRQEVVRALRIVAQGVEDINVVGNADTTQERFPVVSVPGVSDALPLKTLGTGIQRVLAIILSLVNARDGLLLIDEIENGLYHTSQTELWQLIFQLARQLNIQVFATSHSWDSVESFQDALQMNEQAEGMLIRLEPKKGEIKPKLFSGQDLVIIVRDRIEVR